MKSLKINKYIKSFFKKTQNLNIVLPPLALAISAVPSFPPRLCLSPNCGGSGKGQRRATWYCTDPNTTTTPFSTDCARYVYDIENRHLRERKEEPGTMTVWGWEEEFQHLASQLRLLNVTAARG